MQAKEYIKNKIRKFAKNSLSFSGKFRIFIILCFIIVATFEGLNEKVSEKQNKTVPSINLPDINKFNPVQKEKIKTNRQPQKEKTYIMNKILINAALDQHLYESNSQFDNFENLLNEDIDKSHYYINIGDTVIIEIRNPSIKLKE